MSKDDFDNCWITDDFEEHDEQHREEDQILPLGFFERRRYLYTSSLWLTNTESTRLMRSVMAVIGIRAVIAITVIASQTCNLEKVKCYLFEVENIFCYCLS